jgi:hypothetical protein
MENFGQGNGIIINLTFPVFGLENKFQCPGIDIFMPERDIFRAILRFEVVFFAVNLNQHRSRHSQGVEDTAEWSFSV